MQAQDEQIRAQAAQVQQLTNLVKDLAVLGVQNASQTAIAYCRFQLEGCLPLPCVCPGCPHQPSVEGHQGRGVSNLAITDPSSATPPVCFFDLGSWCRAEEAKGPSWSGFWRLCDSYIPCSKDLLVAAVARNKSSLKELKKALLWECQDYHDRLQCQGLL